MREPSYKAKRLAKLLTVAMREHLKRDDVIFNPEEIYPATGWYRTSQYADCHRWQAYYGFVKGNNMGCVGSWDTMTDCVKYGITLGSGAGVTDIEVQSKNPENYPPSERAKMEAAVRRSSTTANQK